MVSALSQGQSFYLPFCYQDSSRNMAFTLQSNSVMCTCMYLIGHNPMRSHCAAEKIVSLLAPVLNVTLVLQFK